MKFVCERCHTRYSIADDKVRQKILKIRCKTCENVITVRDPGASAVAEAPSTTTAAPPPPPPRAATPPPVGAAREWFVAVNGDQQGPVTRAEVARKVSETKPEDEVYIWKEGLDGWKAPAEVPAIQQELSLLRGRSSSPPARPMAPPALGRGQGAPARAAAPAHATARSAPAAATAPVAQANPFAEEDRTQIQPFDAGMLADVAKPAAGAVLPFGGARSNGAAVAALAPAAMPAPAPAPSNLDGLFSDLPPPKGTGDFVPAPASLQAKGKAESGLSKLGGVAGFMSRNPGVKFVAAGAVMVVLIALVVIVFVMAPGEQKPPPPPVAEPTTEKPAAVPGEAEARKAAEDRFKATVGTPPSKTTPVASIGPARDKPDRHKSKATTTRPVASVTPPSATSLEPSPVSPDGVSPPPVRTAAPGERVVQAYKGRSSSESASPSGGPPKEGMINAVVNKHENKVAITTCYERALKRDEKIHGRLEVAVTVGMTGLVKAVSINAPPAFANVESCIKQAVRRWTFPANNEEYQIEFPLIMAGSAAN